MAAVAASVPRPPTGSVRFTDDTVELGAAELDGRGRGHLTVTGLAVGHHEVIAPYDGDERCRPSTAGRAVVDLQAGAALSDDTLLAPSPASATRLTQTSEQPAGVVRRDRAVPAARRPPG